MSAELGENSFPSTISTLLKAGNTVQAVTLFTDNKNSEEVRNNSWDLVPIVARYLTDECETNNIEVFKCCQKLITVIAENSKPEEVLLQFIEELETADDDTKFVMLLKPLEVVLLRVPDKRVTSLGWCFNAIVDYLKKLEVPEDLNLVGEERLLLDSNEIVNRIVYLYNELLSFCETFAKELRGVTSSKNILERKQVVARFFVELLGSPLAFLDMVIYKNTKSKARLLAEELITAFCYLNLDPYKFLEMYNDSDLVKPSDLSLGVFYYLILSEEICHNYLPKVYNPAYTLNYSLTFVNSLLSQDGQFVVEKGIDLAAALLKNVDQLELPYVLLDSENYSKFCKIISNVIVHNECVELRKKGLHALHTFLWSFEHQGRYLLVKNLIRNITHSGLKGNLITTYKEMITQEIKTSGIKNLPPYYVTHKLYNILDEFTLLKQKEETDLVDESDRIIASLNFLRYLVLVDVSGDIGIDSYLETLENGYFKFLRTGINMSQEHYRLRIKEVAEEDTKVETEDCKVSVTVSGKDLIEMPTEKKIEVMQMSLTTLDVIDSILSRVIECIKIKKPNV
ncbi:glomulin [Tribolium castaneum]|uniref:Glomulin-like Protein n=1 Tax=Tribolium castaneum TaxID=7070 RepID=D6WF09_TRICA|nr:PREDICTED: glomulin [Tribolium castaneum]EFA00304.1 Glomulin-like Protein [Tribolium castaneum]|eukprot:XP_008190647.1 PREDICTED: glomulin [Tribolium castaneum]